MVQTDISQLSKECNEWRERLHSYRDEFNQLKSKLQHAANKSLSKDQLTDLEHYQNQLHIQLINIHDLKQAVKAHDRKVNFEVSVNAGQVTDEVYAGHENLYEEYQSLEQTLNDLRNDFNQFVSSLQ
jgi:chromosome segregation ATPase